MKIKKSLIGAGIGIAALVLSACGGGGNPLGEATSAQASPSATGAAVHRHKVVRSTRPGRKRGVVLLPLASLRCPW